MYYPGLGWIPPLRQPWPYIARSVASQIGRPVGRFAAWLVDVFDLDLAFGGFLIGLALTTALIWGAAALGFAWFVLHRCMDGCI